MATYLQLVQQTAEQSGTVPTIGDPATTAGATGRIKRICTWVSKAYEDIQLVSEDWRWLHADFTGSLTTSVQAYDAGALGITTRFRRWVPGPASDVVSTFSIYDPALGVSDETHLELVPWETFRKYYLFGEGQTKQGRPTKFSVAPDNRLYFHEIPDAGYTLRGVYYKSPQVLSSDTDIPEMPAAHHDLIVWRALMRLAIFDEAVDVLPAYERMYMNGLAMLKADQFPVVRLAGGFA